MKTNFIVKLMLLLLLVTLGNFTFAQSAKAPLQFGLSVGASLPVGDFGATSGTDAGFAKLGFSAAFDVEFPVYNMLYWASTVNYSNNSVNESKLGDYLGTTVDAEHYTSLWFLTGPGVEYGIKDIGTAFVNVQAGLVQSDFPDYTMGTAPTTVKVYPESDLAAAYAFNVGLRYHSYKFAIRYVTAKPEYKVVQGLVQVKDKSPLSLIQLTAGICF